MKQFLLIISLFSALANAQTNRFIYDYKYAPDPSKKDSLIEEPMALDISSKGSVFHSYVKLKSDSTISASVKEQMKTGKNQFNFSGVKMGTVRYKVEKEYPEFKTYLITSLGSDQYKVKEDKNIEWEISVEKQTIGKYNAQKATTTFGGREWIAWFTTDLPFQDGPFKFHGLPGLIVKLEDKEGMHNFILNGNQIMPESSQKEEGGISFSMGRKSLVIDYKQFLKVYKDYLADPSKEFRQMSSGGSDPWMKTVTTVMTQDGRKIGQKEMIDNIEKAAKRTALSNQNFIDLDFYKITK